MSWLLDASTAHHSGVSDGAAWLGPCADAPALAEAVREAAGGGPAVRARLDRGVEVARGYDLTGYAAAVLPALRKAAG